MSRFELHLGDCLETLRTMPDNSVDSIVTDPPYGLSFMGKRWDYDVPSVEIWAECLRVLKPGGHLLAFAGTRTQHRMAVRIEDAGFEIRDMIAWVYGSGFPKSLDVSKAIDKAAGAKREVVGQKDFGPSSLGNQSNADNGYRDRVYTEGLHQITAPATDAARQWQGWGTALKPAMEPITVARKPLSEGTVAANVLQHGTGALNIDGCRVAAEKATGWKGDGSKLYEGGLSREGGEARPQDAGRWPANLCHDGSEPADLLGEAARFFQQCKSGYNEAWHNLNLPQENANTAEQSLSQQRRAAVSALVLAVNSALPEGLLCSALSTAPSTTATGIELRQIAEIVTQTIKSIDSRFWHESKPARLTLSLNHASDAEIKRLTDTTTITVSRWKSDGSVDPVTFSITQQNLEAGERDCAPSTDGKRFIYCAKASKRDRGEGNTHPTVKPTDLMAYLCRLVTPPGGIVLDPFMGSGSTGKAAMREGFRFIGCEMSPEYLEIARARIESALKVL